MKKQKVNVEQISETKLQLSISNFILSFWKAEKNYAINYSYKVLQKN